MIDDVLVGIGLFSLGYFSARVVDLYREWKRTTQRTRRRRSGRVIHLRLVKPPRGAA